MSADPFVQAPYNTQSYNRYSYVFNNPLSFTDPSGYNADMYKDYGGRRGGECDKYGNCTATYTVDTSPGSDAWYWSNFYQQQQQNLQNFVERAFNFTGIPTAFRAAIDVQIAINMGDYTAVGTAVVAGVTEFGTKKVKTVQEIAGLAKDAKKAEAKVEKALETKKVEPRNGHLAGSTHPKTGVPFDKDGFPDFSKYKINEVKINQTGSRAGDAREANKAAGLKSTPDGYVWHHHQDGKTMQLVPENLHSKTGHTGGYSGN